MSEPLTVTEQSEIRSEWASGLPFYDLQKLYPNLLVRLLDEVADLKAKLARLPQP